MFRETEIEGFNSGESVQIHGTVHDKEIGKVVEWNNSFPRPRGMIPVFLHRYPKKPYWLFHRSLVTSGKS